MFFNKTVQPKDNISVKRALRHLVVFQIKLAADALRDFLLSPVSILVFIIDVVRKPEMKDSLYLRLMVIGRRSDRVINLFDEHNDESDYTIDETIAQIEDAIQKSRD